MQYNIIKFVLNDKDQYVAEVSATFGDLEKALVNYHNALAALHNAADCKYAVVKIEDQWGNEILTCKEAVDHMPVETETPTES